MEITVVVVDELDVVVLDSTVVGNIVVVTVVLTVVENPYEPVEPVKKTAPDVVEEGAIVVVGDIPTPVSGITGDVVTGGSVAGTISGGIVVLMILPPDPVCKLTVERGTPPPVMMIGPLLPVSSGNIVTGCSADESIVKDIASLTRLPADPTCTVSSANNDAAIATDTTMKKAIPALIR